MHNVVIIDVREAVEFVTGHAPGAINIPLSELADRLSDVPHHAPVYVICEVGGRSARATQWLEGQGLDVTNIEGGTAAWRSLGLPLEVPA
jgi:rhodanese-related sulfurtransferase